MAEELKIPIKSFQNSGIETKIGSKVTLKLGNNRTVNATIKKVENEAVIVDIETKPK